MLLLYIGVVFNYTKTGVRRDYQGWERCICIPLVQPDMYNLLDQWDQYLDKFSNAQMWDPVCQRWAVILALATLRRKLYI